MSGDADASVRAEIMQLAAELGGRYLAGLDARSVAPDDAAVAGLAALDVPLQAKPLPPAEVVRELDRVGSPAAVASAGGRYFGFVVGGSLPVTVGAAVLASAWDQNGGLNAMSPVATALESVAAKWTLAALGLPEGAAVGFTTGATMGNFTALAAARHALLARSGWNVEEEGLFGAPLLDVVVGEEVHVSVMKALAMLGLGRARVVRVPVDGQGRMRADMLPKLGPATIVCVQAGNVNTGAFDPLEELTARARDAGAWVHVDGAFGLWAQASASLSHLAAGAGEADSWSTDAHKWLNVPYDSGLAIVRDPGALHGAMANSAAYLIEGRRDGFAFVPEMSRRARGIEVWAALRSLGRNGLADLIERCVAHARRFADGLRAGGFEILNEVVLNQVLVSFRDAERTNRVIAAIQRDGTCWCGGTVWQGKTAMRISVSSWATTTEDVDRSVAAMLRVAAETN